MVEGAWETESDVITWTMTHKATMAAELAWKNAKLPDIYKALEPIREAYRRLDDEERQNGLIAQIIRYVVSRE